jgi:hypothetical protein
MEYMSFWQLVENSPEWVGVFANALFAATTIVVIIWQVCVMKAQTRVMRLQVRAMRWQGHLSARHEGIQNRLTHLQLEREWVFHKNREREQLLKLARKLHLAAGCLEQPSGGNKLIWEEVQDTVHELSERLRILDVVIYSGEYGMWFPSLSEYVAAVLDAVIGDSDEIPNLSTRKAMKAAEDRYKPINIFLDLEAAIRMEFFDFKNKWDAALPG